MVLGGHVSAPHGQGPEVSRLGDLVAAVRARFDAAADATPIMIGSGYELRGVGAGPRVVFIPHTAGKLGPPSRVGQMSVATVSAGCDVHVRAPEGGDDAFRFDLAERLADRVVNALRAIGPGRVELGNYSDNSPAPVDAFGADISLSFTYARQVPRDAAIWTVATTPAAPPDPMRPNGSTGDTFAIDATTTPTGRS